MIFRLLIIILLVSYSYWWLSNRVFKVEVNFVIVIAVVLGIMIFSTAFLWFLSGILSSA